MTKEQHIETTTLPTIEELLSYPYEVKRERKKKQMKRLINHLYNAAAKVNVRFLWKKPIWIVVILLICVLKTIL